MGVCSRIKVIKVLVQIQCKLKPNKQKTKTEMNENKGVGVDIDFVLKKFLPRVWLHSEEKYFPCTPEWYIQRSSMYIEEQQVVAKGQLTADTLPDISNRIGNQQLQYLETDVADQVGETDKVPSDIPFLVRWKEDDSYYLPSIVFIYAYNGPYTVLGKEYGAHNFDSENVTLQINKSTLELEWMYFSAHAEPEGTWVKGSDLEYYNGRPVVFSAKYSHASYWKAKTWWRICGLANDRTDYGQLWDPQNYVLLTPNGTKWIQYQGWMGGPGPDGHVCTPLYKELWDGESQYSCTPFVRFFGWMQDVCPNCCNCVNLDGIHKIEWYPQI